MKKLQPTKLSLLIAMAFAAPAIWAQQTPTDIGRITVEGMGGAATGLMTAEESPKARSSVNKDQLDKLNPTSNPYQAIEMLPGVNTFSYDATGMFGGGLRVRGFNSDELGFTINGAPVNDSGSFSVYPQEYTDTSNLCEVFLTQGASDTEAPHVGAAGGNIGMVSCAPADKFAFRWIETIGDLNLIKTELRLDTGKFANDQAKAFVSYSKATVNKFKGEGKADRQHVDIGLEFKPNNMFSASTSFLYNNAVNNNYYTLSYANIASFGRSLDYWGIPYAHAVGVNGTAQVETVPGSLTPTNNIYYGFSANPFRNYLWTGKAEWKIAKDVNLSAEPYFWYGYGTGGTLITTLAESNASTKIGGGIRDINGDGDTLDTIAVYRGSVTETNRPGITLKADARIDNQKLLGGIWYERANHKQTQPAVRLDNAGNSASFWLDDANQYLLRQDGTQYQGRNQLTISTGTSLFLQDTVSLMKDQVTLQMGAANRSVERNFTNYKNEGTGQGVDYNIVKTYTAFLPSFGIKANLDADSHVYFNVAKNMKAPGNFSFQNLMIGGSIVNGQLQGATMRDPIVQMETSNNLDLGYRYSNNRVMAAATLFAVDFQNRISTAYDPVANLSIDNNVGAVATRGLELETGYQLDKNWSLYGSVSYTSSTMQSDLCTSATACLATSGKQLPDTPLWMGALRVNYASGSLYGNVDLKYTGTSYSNLLNNESMHDYGLINLTLGYRFADMGLFKKPSLQLNVANLFDQQYERISSGSGSSFTQSTPAFFYMGAPRFTSLTFRTEF